MKRTWNSRHFGMAALCCGLGLMMTDLALAQQPAAPQLQQRQQQLQQQQQTTRQQTQRQTGEKQFCLASELIGMHAKAKGDEKVGEIRNLIINQDGQVQYVAVSATAGGADKAEATPRAQILQPDRDQADRTAATSGKLTLVPWELVKLEEGATAGQSYVAIDIEKDRLMSAPSFSEQQLTARQGQMQLTSQVDQFFNVRSQRGAARPQLDTDRQQQDQDRPRGILPRSDDTPRSDETPRNDDN